MRHRLALYAAAVLFLGAWIPTTDAQPAPLLTETVRFTTTVTGLFTVGFGSSVSLLDGPSDAVLDGAHVYAAAYYHQGDFQEQGGVYAFWPDPSGGWITVDTLVAPDDRFRFGDWLGLNVTRVIRLPDGTDLVAANAHHLRNNPADTRDRSGGGVEVFRLWPAGHPGGEPGRIKWMHEATLEIPPDPATGHRPLHLGLDLALIATPDGGASVLAGATGNTDTTFTGGQVCVFHRSADGVWTAGETIRFESPLLSLSGFIGETVGAAASARLAGGRVVIAGAKDARYPTSTYNSGAAYVLERQPDGTWREAARLEPDDLTTAEGFGYDVAVVDAPEGLFAFVGHSSELPSTPGGPDYGAVYVYRRTGEDGDGLGVWERETTLRPAGPRGRFGWRLSAAALTGGGIALGVTAQSASTPECGCGLDGAAYVYHRDANSGAWSAVARLAPSNPSASAYYGRDIAVTPGGLALVGRVDRIPGDVNGTAYLYDLRERFPVASAEPPTNRPAAPVAVEQVWPQPAALSATVAVRLSAPGTVRLAVVDALGRTVLSVDAGERAAGQHDLRLDVSRLAVGVYAVRVSAPGGSATARLVVAR